MVTRLDIHDIVVILAGSRTGSSFLFEALRSRGRFLAPDGEETPFYRKNGIGLVDSRTGSDALSSIPSAAILDKVASALIGDLGIKDNHCFEPAVYSRKMVDRFQVQWPGSISPGALPALTSTLTARLAKLPAEFNDWRAFYLSWINELAAQGLPIGSARYDTGAPATRPPSAPLLEEPPFVIPMPACPVSIPLLRECPLLLKSSSNAYRISFLKALFPRARFKWIVLTRNPAATVSALMDGWLSAWFHSHFVHDIASLEISGYSEVVAGGHEWWKFDLPPGWADFTRSSLAEVCAFQWHSAYENILRFVQQTADPVFSIRYEAFLAGGLEPALQDLLEFAGTKPVARNRWNPAAPVASITPPAPGKWKKRSATLLPLIQSEAVRAMAGSLGYDTREANRWP